MLLKPPEDTGVWYRLWSRTPHPWGQGKTDARADLERKQPGAIELVSLSSDPGLSVGSAQDQVEQIPQSSG